MSVQCGTDDVVPNALLEVVNVAARWVVTLCAVPLEKNRGWIVPLAV